MSTDNSQNILEFPETKVISNDDFVYVGKTAEEDEHNDVKLDACGGLVNKEFRLTYSDFTLDNYDVDLSSVEYNRNFLSFKINNNSDTDININFDNYASFIGHKITIMVENASTGTGSVKIFARTISTGIWGNAIATAKKEIAFITIMFDVTNGGVIDKLITSYKPDGLGSGIKAVDLTISDSITTKDLTVSDTLVIEDTAEDSGANPFIPLNSAVISETDVLVYYDLASKTLKKYDPIVDNIDVKVLSSSMTQEQTPTVTFDNFYAMHYKDGSFCFSGSLTLDTILPTSTTILTYTYDNDSASITSHYVHMMGYYYDGTTGEPIYCLIVIKFNGTLTTNNVSISITGSSSQNIPANTPIYFTNNLMRMYWIDS